MKRSNGLVLALVLLGGAGILITRLLLDNYQMKVELGALKSHQQHVAKAPPPAPVAAAAAVPIAAGNRTVLESARQMMTDALSSEEGSEKKFWIRVDPRDREASGFAGEIASVFRDSGWDVKVLDNQGLRFKPGLLLLIGGEEDPPVSYILTAQRAVEAIGEPVTTGRGYRTYYETKKRETPSWQGTEFLPEQTFVLLVGRKGDPQAAAAQ